MTFIINKLKDLKFFNWKLFISLCLTALIPAIYQTIRTFLISSSASVEGIDVIGQMEWFDLINETLLAFLIVPLYSIFNKLDKDKEKFSNLVFKLGLLIIVIYLLFQLGVFFYANSLVANMNPSEVDVNLVSNYLRIETIAFIVGIIYSVSNVIFIVLGKTRNVYALLLVNAITLIISDFLLVPDYGVMGVAYSNILVNGLLSLISVILLILNKAIRVSKIKKDDFKALKVWAIRGLFSGSQSLLDNLIYALMVVKMVNMVLEQGNYWVANNFIWGWMLIPISALGEVIKHDANDYFKLKQSNYYLIVIFVAILWTISIPLWSVFYQYVEQLENHQDIFIITLKLYPFYIAYALCIIPDNIFIGLGKTYYNAINSLIINLVYYGIFYILYVTNSITFSMDMIILMFGFGNATHMCVSFVEQYVFVKRLKNANQRLLNAK